MNGLRIGRIFGIDIQISRSWIFIFILLAWNLTAVFTEWHPAWPTGTRLFLAVVAALMFFGSIVLHELAHALVARAHGVQVRNITLFIFGGVSNMEEEPPSPRAEFLTAVVGPLVSIALGIVFLAIASALTNLSAQTPDEALAVASQLDPLTTLLVWLGPVNISVGVFNLIPGFPLDGGRLLRATIWRVTGNLQVATRWAAMTGQAIGWAFVFAGIAMVLGARLPLLGSGLVGGLWIAFIGWFLSSAAQRSYQHMLIEDALEGMPVHRLMRPITMYIPADTLISDAVNNIFLRNDQRSFPVMKDGAFVGIVSVDDLRRADQSEWPMMRIAKVMTARPELIVAKPDDSAVLGLRQLTKSKVAQLPIVVDDNLVGMLHLADLARWIDLHVRTPANYRYRPRRT